MAYILGYIYADGSLENSPSIRGKYLRVSSVDLGLINNVKKYLGSDHNIITRNPYVMKVGSRRYASKKSYSLRIGSHKIYSSLERLGLYPRKSLTIRLPAIPQLQLPHFLRGVISMEMAVCF